MKNNYSIYAVAVVMTVIILAAGCSLETQNPQTGTNGNVGVNVQGNDSTGTDTVATGDVKEIQMTAKQFEFIPSRITVKKGDTVRLIVTSTDIEHGIAIPEFGVDQKLSPNEPKTVEFVADKAGEFSYICSIYCGGGHGAMRGTLVVTE